MAVTISGTTIRGRNLAEGGQHIAVLGDSISFGAASTGATPPKWSNCWVGQMRTNVNATYGNYGTGLVIGNAVLPANPTWDPRFAFGGTVNLTAWGYFRVGVFTTVAGSANYVEFTTTCTKFRTYIMAGTSGVVNVSIDGGATIVCRNVATGGTTPDIEKLSGPRADHIVTEIPAGSLASHTIRIWGNGGDVNIFGVEGRTGNGGYEISNPSVSGKSLGSFFGNSGANDEVTGHYGLPLIDTLAPYLLIIALAANDWQSSATIANVTSWLTTLIARQAANGGRSMLWLPPIPSSVLQPGGGPTWSDYQDAFLSVSVAQGVPFLDNSFLYGASYAAGNALGKYADTIHPSDSGAADIAASVRSFLGL